MKTGIYNTWAHTVSIPSSKRPLEITVFRTYVQHADSAAVHQGCVRVLNDEFVEATQSGRDILPWSTAVSYHYLAASICHQITVRTCAHLCLKQIGIITLCCVPEVSERRPRVFESEGIF